MSTTYQVRCELCGEDGPVLQRTAGGTALLASLDPSVVSPSWGEFLNWHEYHPLSLVQEHCQSAGDRVAELEAENRALRQAVGHPCHVAVFDETGWALEHSMSCRVAGTMTTCEYDRCLRTWVPDDPERLYGRWDFTSVVNGKPVLAPFDAGAGPAR